jgi:hypothetical protein
MNTPIQYAFRVDDTQETPCHVADIKKGDVFYLVTGGHKSELYKATGDAISSAADGQLHWSIPHEIYR